LREGKKKVQEKQVLARCEWWAVERGQQQHQCVIVNKTKTWVDEGCGKVDSIDKLESGGERSRDSERAYAARSA
jgi:hypothetical protein